MSASEVARALRLPTGAGRPIYQGTYRTPHRGACASICTDAHTVGIDAIMNRKGYAGHYGLERYEMIDAYNLGSPVANEDFIAKAVEMKADALLLSQTVTQKDIHIKNLSELIEMLEAERVHDKLIVCCGGARITQELAKELGYDASFGMNTFADDMASFIAQKSDRRQQHSGLCR